MADSKISSLTEITTVNASDISLIIQSGVPKKVQNSNLLAANSVTAAKMAANEINSALYSIINASGTGIPGDASIFDIFFGANILRVVGDIVESEALVFVANTPNTGVVKIKINDAGDTNKTSDASDVIQGSSVDIVKIKNQIVYLSNTTCLVISEINHFVSGYLNASKTKIFRSAVNGMSFSTGFRIQMCAYAASLSPIITIDYINIRLIRKI